MQKTCVLYNKSVKRNYIQNMCFITDIDYYANLLKLEIQ